MNGTLFNDLNGFHATCGEISVTMHCHPEAYKTPHPFNYFPTVKKSDWPLSPERFRETFPDGRMESDPRMCSAEHGRQIFTRAVDAITRKISPEDRQPIIR